MNNTEERNTDIYGYFYGLFVDYKKKRFLLFIEQSIIEIYNKNGPYKCLEIKNFNKLPMSPSDIMSIKIMRFGLYFVANIRYHKSNVGYSCIACLEDNDTFWQVRGVIKVDLNYANIDNIGNNWLKIDECACNVVDCVDIEGFPTIV